MRFIRIQSCIGAVGAFFVLQAYGLLLLYELVKTVERLRSTTGMSPSQVVPQGVFFFVLFAAFMFVQFTFLSEIAAHLATMPLARHFPDEFTSPWEIAKAVATVIFLVLVPVLWFRPGALGFFRAKPAVLIAYQVGHPLAAFLGARMFGAGRKTKPVKTYLPRSTVVTLALWWIFGGLLLWLLDVLFIEDQLRIFATSGLGISSLGLILLLVQGPERQDTPASAA